MNERTVPCEGCGIAVTELRHYPRYGEPVWVAVKDGHNCSQVLLLRIQQLEEKVNLHAQQT